MEPPICEFLIAVLTLSANSFAELPPLDGAAMLVTELVISLPAPKISEPLELNVLLAVPTMLFAMPE